MVDIEDDWESFLQTNEYDNDIDDSINEDHLIVENKDENPQLKDVKNIPKCTAHSSSGSSSHITKAT